jgi:hypothetical protein
MTLLDEWTVSRWFNTPEPLSLKKLRGRVVMIHTFQMLCPGCVLRALPQAQRVQQQFEKAPLQVIGLHTVFEHHRAMGNESLAAFLHEFRVTFPVGVDAIGKGPLPETMARYGLRGTPTTLLVDARGHLRAHHFGAHEDLTLGAEIATLLAELEASTTEANTKLPKNAARDHGSNIDAASGCLPDGCILPGVASSAQD